MCPPSPLPVVSLAQSPGASCVQAIVQSLETLFLLGALDQDLHITTLGEAMALYPVDPQHAKALCTSLQAPYFCSRAMAVIIAMLSVENLFYTPKNEQEVADRQRRLFASVYGDQLTLLNIFKVFMKVIPTTPIPTPTPAPAPCPGSDPASGHPTAQQPPLGEFPHRWYGMSAGTHLPMVRAVALLRVNATQSSDTGTVQGVCWHNQPREQGVGR